MSAFWSGNMGGPVVKTPLLLLMLCLSALTSTVICQESEDEITDSVTVIEEEEDAGETEADTTTTALDVSLATSPAPPEDHSSYSEEDSDSQGSGDGLKRTRLTDLYDADSSLPSSTYPDLPESTFVPVEEEGLNPMVVLIPAALLVLIISAVVCGVVLNHRWNQKAGNQQSSTKEPYLDVDEGNTEKVPMPMFEEDVPSVLELEMDELDQWIKRDSGPEESLPQA